MPLREIISTSDHIKIILWNSSETEGELVSALGDTMPFYAEQLKNISCIKRRIEFLTVRVMVKCYIGNENIVCYTEAGKPYLRNASVNFSISHTNGCIAIALHDQNMIGVDVEYRSPKILKLRDKFMNKEEFKPFNDDETYALIIWSAKESMFKAISSSEIDFKTHLHTSFSGTLPEGYFEALSTKDKTTKHQIFYKIYPNFVLTACQG